VIVDAHTDVLLQVVVREGEAQSLELALHPGLFERYWLPRLEAGGVGEAGAVFCEQLGLLLGTLVYLSDVWWD